MKIKLLFVTQGCDAVLYRFNLGWVLEEMNSDLFEITTVDCSKMDIGPLLRDQHMVIYYRVLHIGNSCLEAALKSGKLVSYMIDDYLLDLPPGREVLSLMSKAHLVLVTTKLLKNLYQKAGVKKPFFVKQHGLPVERLLALRKIGRIDYPDRFRIGWLGGVTHAMFSQKYEDFLQALGRYDIPITFVCFDKPADFLERVAQIPNVQIENHPFIPFHDEIGYYTALSNLALNTVVNMVTPSKLAEGKSELKFMETGLYKYPLLTSPVGIYKELIQEGINGMKASSMDEFVKKVIYLQRNLPVRTKIAERAHQQVVRDYNVKQKAKEFADYLGKFVIANLPGGWGQWGQLIKGEKPAVFLVAFGHKHVIANPQVFNLLGCRWEQVKVLPESQIDAVPTGFNLDISEEEFV